MPFLSSFIVLASLLVPSGGSVLDQADQLTEMQRNTLRGLTSVQLMYVVDEDDACNIDREDLMFAGFFPFVNRDIKVLGVSSTERDATIVVKVDIIRPSGIEGCIAQVDAFAFTEASVVLAYGPTTRESMTPASVLLWEGRELMTTGTADFDERVRTTVRRFFEEFAAKVELANQDQR